MKQKFSRAHWRARLGLPAFALSALASVVATPWTVAFAQSTSTPPPYCTSASPGQTPTYCITWSAVTNGGIHRARSSCYLLSASMGQLSPAPGFAYSQSGGSGYAVFSGFWAAAQTAGLDEIFFNGFEGCGQ